MTISDAREIVRANPKAYRAAFVEAPGWPLLDHPQAKAALHSKVGAAYDQLRERKAELVAQGYTVTGGTLGANVLRLENGSDVRVIGIDKPTRKAKRGQSRSSTPSE